MTSKPHALHALIESELKMTDEDFERMTQRIAELEQEKRTLLDSVADLEEKWEAEVGRSMSAESAIERLQRDYCAVLERGEAAERERDEARDRFWYLIRERLDDEWVRGELGLDPGDYIEEIAWLNAIDAARGGEGE